jgi:RNA polymerase sigma-70 factor (ECF subfamily)
MSINITELYQQHADEIHRYMRRCVPEQAEDLTQETFFRAWRAQHTFRGGNLRAWLFQIAGNAARDLVRRDKVVQMMPLEHAENVTTADDIFMDNLYCQSVVDAMQRIPSEKQRQALILYTLGYDFPAIASHLNVRATNIKCLVQRARQALREALEED